MYLESKIKKALCFLRLLSRTYVVIISKRTRRNACLTKECCFLNNILQLFLFLQNSYEFQVKPKNPLGEGPVSNTVAFSTESGNHMDINLQ